MKLLRADPQDRDDMVRLWPRCSFDSADAAVVAFYDAYPHLDEDEYLVDYVTKVIDQSEAATARDSGDARGGSVQ